MFNNLMKKIVAWLDPKLEKYRNKTPVPKYFPKTIEEFIDVLRRTPKNVLSDGDRSRISAIMGVEGRKVKDLMAFKKDMVFVHGKDFLGPLMLDKLYKSGFVHFPVVDDRNHVMGIIHTEALNTLEIKKTDRATKYLDKKVFYLHEDDSLNFAIEELIRTNYFYFLVLNKKDELAGFFTLEMLVRYLLPQD